MDDALPVVVIGAGPAGLTAALELARAGVRAVVVEADDVVGGLSRTVVHGGWRVDLGGHRFFTKEPRVAARWQELLGPDEFPVRRRQSRILYRGRLYDYPLKAANVLATLGPLEAARCVASYAAARIRPPADQASYEGWLVARFGRRLYERFFRTYTEKVWGVPPGDMPADWAAQRVQDLDLWRAVRQALAPVRGPVPASLIGEFRYPVLGAGAMWERCREAAEDAGAAVELSTSVEVVHTEGARVTGCTVRGPDGARRRIDCSHIVSSMPLGALVGALDPPAPDRVRLAAAGLTHRDFLVVALVVPADKGFSDQWIYVHTPDVAVGRIQNFASWSPAMVKPGRTLLGLEYFASEGDPLWRRTDAELVALATGELASVGLADAGCVEEGFVVRVPKAYPYYDGGYRAGVETIAGYLREAAPNLHPVGRNGMHKYNNQDHSMLTAMLAVENILGADHNVWSVNTAPDHHEAAPGVQGAGHHGAAALAR